MEDLLCQQGYQTELAEQYSAGMEELEVGWHQEFFQWLGLMEDWPEYLNSQIFIWICQAQVCFLILVQASKTKLKERIKSDNTIFI